MNKYTRRYTYRSEHCPELERATDEAGNLSELARRTGISRRRLGKIRAGSPPSQLEMMMFQNVAARRL